jgi:hypothetical protein
MKEIEVSALQMSQGTWRFIEMLSDAAKVSG